MRKVLVGIIFGLALLAGGFWYFASRDVNQRFSQEEKVYTIKESYRYLNNQENYHVNIFINRDESLFDYLEKAEAYLSDINLDTVVKIDLKGVKTGEKVSYQEELYTVYDLSFKIAIEALEINNAFLKINFETKSYNLNLGSFKICDSKDLMPFKNFNKLLGLSFKTPYLSLGGIVIGLVNKEASTLKITGIKLDSDYQFGLDTVNYKNETAIESLIDYRYDKAFKFNHFELAPKESKTVLIPITYLKQERLMNTYLIIETNFGDFYLDNFCYLKNHDLNMENSLVTLGEINEV